MTSVRNLGRGRVRCVVCGREGGAVSRAISVCGDCLRDRYEGVCGRLDRLHADGRHTFGLPQRVPADPSGRQCRLCVNQCRIAEGEYGYCGVRTATYSGIVFGGGDARTARVEWYHDPLPTNCVADWVCPAGTAAGYPRYSYRPGPEHAYTNLAVFYRACSFDCLFCQNWQFKVDASGQPWRHASELVRAVDDHTACICFFGGDPVAQLPHSLLVARQAVSRQAGRVLRICWETNGSMHPALARAIGRVALKSGGCVKVDLKAWNEPLHRALCGVTNRRTLGNFTLLAGMIERRSDPPPLVASTLLVPGYVDVKEVSQIARFIAGLNPGIPYSLLGFHPQFLMDDLPKTSRSHAEECLAAAKAAGLTRVRVGNVHLLSEARYS